MYRELSDLKTISLQFTWTTMQPYLCGRCFNILLYPWIKVVSLSPSGKGNLKIGNLCWVGSTLLFKFPSSSFYYLTLHVCCQGDTMGVLSPTQSLRGQVQLVLPSASAVHGEGCNQPVDSPGFFFTLGHTASPWIPYRSWWHHVAELYLKHVVHGALVS